MILGAALQLLEAEGVERLTTNHIAARAGVSSATPGRLVAHLTATRADTPTATTLEIAL